MKNLDKKCEHPFLFKIDKRKRVDGKLRPLGTCYSGCLEIPITSKYEKIGAQLIIDNGPRDVYKIHEIKNRTL